MNTQYNNYTKNSQQANKIGNLSINGFSFICPFYSIRLKEFTKVYNYHLSSLAIARACSITLCHFNKYHRGLKTTIQNIYNIKWSTMTQVLEILTGLGLIRSYPTKRITNIGKYVNLTNYGITVKGKEVAADLNELLSKKVNLRRNKF